MPIYASSNVSKMVMYAIKNNVAKTLSINISSPPRMKSDDCLRRCCGAIELKRGVIIVGPV
ncbi:hypothetical protein HanXRQr2_Chr09g0369961 [Helianthus annuus]|uniref:Uncharacterized protein n=1 Tax=Helianthus annuus TaxID=4232 RepID=A0A9K3I3X8_HELAN|nr:hypothetical protein HanXRQr2_Chr09g0369961 [Helianthus annuus]